MLDTEPKRIGAARFKETCLDHFDHLPPEGLIVTKHGRPVARILPFEVAPTALLGCMAGRIQVHGDLLTTGLSWEAGGDDQPCDANRRR